MENIELLGEIADKFQLTPQEIIRYFVESKKVDSAFLSKMSETAKTFDGLTFIPSKKFVTPKLILPGMYAYADGLIYPDYISEAQLQSIVGYVGKVQILSWCLRSKELVWAERSFNAGTEKLDMSGPEATRKIIAEGQKQGIKTPAAEYAITYAEDGVKPGTAFMDSYCERKLLCSGMGAVDRSLNAVGCSGMRECIWSSSESSSGDAWFLKPGTGAAPGGSYTYGYKGSYCYVRPVLALPVLF